MSDDRNRPPNEPAAPLPQPPEGGAGASSLASAEAAGGSAQPSFDRPAAGAVSHWPLALAAVAVVAALGAVALAASSQQRLRALEAELVKRQQDSGGQAAEARAVARNAEEVARDAAAKTALLEARVAENAVQRSQIEELIQSLARSRDEGVLADLEAAIRVAQQQSAITGSGEPLVLALQQADERLARYSQPRLERVRRAVLQDLERSRAAGGTDISALTIRLDELIRQIDELPLAVLPERARPVSGKPGSPAVARPAAAASAAAAAASAPQGWMTRAWRTWESASAQAWQEIKGLVRVSRIEHPEAMLVAPEQAFFLRENLKLRLLNARLALLSRQFDTAQADLRDAQAALERYFDRGQRRVTAAQEQVRQLMAQARLVVVPRPDATLAAIAAASAGR